jgi:hypothetical protein
MLDAGQEAVVPVAAIDRVATLVRIEARAAAALAGMGYRLLAVEIDVDAKRARVEVRRHDGYTLTLDVRRGAGTITREMLRHETVTVGRRGDRFLADRLSMKFLGRTRVSGEAWAALHAFADAIGDNATANTLNARDAIGRLLAPTLELTAWSRGLPDRVALVRNEDPK